MQDGLLEAELEAGLLEHGLLIGALGDETIDGDLLLLADTVTARHGLDVVLRIYEKKCDKKKRIMRHQHDGREPSRRYSNQISSHTNLSHSISKYISQHFPKSLISQQISPTPIDVFRQAKTVCKRGPGTNTKTPKIIQESSRAITDTN